GGDRRRRARAHPRARDDLVLACHAAAEEGAAHRADGGRGAARDLAARGAERAPDLRWRRRTASQPAIPSSTIAAAPPPIPSLSAASPHAHEERRGPMP